MTRRNAFLIKISILLVFSVLTSGILIVDLEKNEGFSDSRSYNNYNNLENAYLKSLTISDKIHINGSAGWVAFRSAGYCTGEGTQIDPYIIENLEIDAKWLDSGIFIENSDAYFKIENCIVFNSGHNEYDAGIKLKNIQNALVRKNDCQQNGIGIYLINSNNNAIIGNLVHHSLWEGIFLETSDNNVISLNTMHFNNYDGILLRYSNYNKIWGNTLSIQDNIAIQLHRSNYNAIAGNILQRNWCGGIFLRWSNKNIIISNIAILAGGDFRERDCEGNVYLFNIGSLHLLLVFPSLFILAIVVYKSKKPTKKNEVKAYEKKRKGS
jgi:parallel beta-helix repeat protein